MDWLKIVGIVLGSNLLVEVFKIWAAKKADQRKRKNQLEDRKMAKDDETKTLEQRFDDFCQEQKAENRELRQRLSGVENTLGTLCENTAAGEYITMRREALEYIKQGEVNPEDRLLLRERYERYKMITGKNDLHNIMAEVANLPTKH